MFLDGGTVSKARIINATPEGEIILKELIERGVLKDVSAAEVGFLSDFAEKEPLLKELAEGNRDASFLYTTWHILQDAYTLKKRKIKLDESGAWSSRQGLLPGGEPLSFYVSDFATSRVSR